MYVDCDDRPIHRFKTNTKESKWYKGNYQKQDVKNTHSAKFHDMISHPQIFDSTLKTVTRYSLNCSLM